MRYAIPYRLSRSRGLLRTCKPTAMTDRRNAWGGLGETHYNWRPDVGRTVDRTLNRFSALSANTYYNHPWPGGDGVSVDYWSTEGRGHPISRDLGWRTVRYLMRMRRGPMIRHLIFRYSLWTSSGGWQEWHADDHVGSLQHVHVTYW